MSKKNMCHQRHNAFWHACPTRTSSTWWRMACSSTPCVHIASFFLWCPAICRSLWKEESGSIPITMLHHGGKSGNKLQRCLAKAQFKLNKTIEPVGMMYNDVFEAINKVWLQLWDTIIVWRGCSVGDFFIAVDSKGCTHESLSYDRIV